jgi:3-methyl-2-oxobutanoate hydroxymethyltransferase
MPRIFDFGGHEVERRQTVAGLRGLKGSRRRATQTTAESVEEAAAAVEMVVCRAANVPQVRQGSQRLFVTAAPEAASVSALNGHKWAGPPHR